MLRCVSDSEKIQRLLSVSEEFVSLLLSFFLSFSLESQTHDWIRWIKERDPVTLDNIVLITPNELISLTPLGLSSKKKKIVIIIIIINKENEKDNNKENEKDKRKRRSNRRR